MIVTQSSIEQNAIREYNGAYEDTNFGGIEVGENDNVTDYFHQGFFRISFADIPRGSVIHACSFYGMPTDDKSSNTHDYSIYHLKKAYVDNQVTWNSYKTGSAWDNPGARTSSDRDTTPCATESMSGSNTAEQIWTFNAYGRAILQSIADGRLTNFGFIIKSDYNTWGANDKWDLSSTYVIINYDTMGEGVVATPFMRI